MKYEFEFPLGEDTETVDFAFKFKKDESSVIDKIKVMIGDKIIEAKVMEKDKAKGVYEESMAEGL
mgnify:CR=1 FL=1